MAAIFRLACGLGAGAVALGCGGADPPAPGPPPYGLLDASRPAWSAAPAMHAARAWATATRLSGGRVLVAGGQRLTNFDSPDESLDSAEIFDGAKWKIAAHLNEARTQHAAVALADGRVLVVGGFRYDLMPSGPTFTPSATAEIFDPIFSAWTPTPALAAPRILAAAVRLGDGRVLVTGGSDAAGGSAELYDPAQDLWSTAAAPAIPRHLHTATLLPDGRVLVAGGAPHDGGKGALTSTEIYDPFADAWAPGPPLGTGRLAHTATPVPEGVLVTGGATFADGGGEVASVEIYDTTQAAWVSAPPLGTARAGHAATRLDDGGVLVTGGQNGTTLPREVELYDPGPKRWAMVAPLARGRVHHAAAALAKAGALVAGGQLQSSAEVYVLGGLGEPCSVGRECKTGFCADGVCCGSACGAHCHTCASVKGTCLPAAAGTDARRECGDGEPCADACASGGGCAPRVGQTCAETGCSADGRAQIDPTACVSGNLACPAQTTACGAFLCDPLAGRCRTHCASVADCALGLACDLAGACVPAPGAVAGDAGLCAAGSAVDGAPRAAPGALAVVAGLSLAAFARRRARRRRVAGVAS